MLGVASCRGRNQHPLFLPPRMTYAEKLKDPRWQKKRLEVLGRDNFTCLMCGDTETELHIHHEYYPNSMNPWDIDIDDLTTYCKHCHSLVEHTKNEFPVFTDVFKTKTSSKYVKLYASSLPALTDLFVFNYKDGKVYYESHIPISVINRLSQFINPNLIENVR